MPDDRNAEWVRRVLGVAVPAPVIAPERLATLRRTLNTLRGQSPELAVGPLGHIASELLVAEMTADDQGGVLPAEARRLKAEVESAQEGLAARAQELAREHATAWAAGVAALPAGGDRPAGRAKAIQQLVARIEQGVAQDRYMLRQVGADDAVLAASTVSAAALKREYATLLPVPSGQPPTPLTGAAKPRIAGALTTEEQGQLTRLMTAAQAAMGADRPVEPDEMDKATGLIAKGIDAEDAAATLARLKTWDAVKAEYRTTMATDRAAAEAFMAKMWWFRRMTVDATMTALQRLYGFTWGSVGSDNPESDYDLTVRTHGRAGGDVKWDYAIVQEANDLLSRPYDGTPPGILFDTNLYAEAAAAPQPPEHQADPAVRAMGAMKEQGQDVGALMKLRRFMEWDEYEAYKQDMLAGIRAPADRALVARQFEEADSLYFIAQTEQLRKAAELEPTSEARQTATGRIDATPLTPEGQRTLLAMAAALEHDAARSMAASNAIYVEKLSEVRAIEKQYDAEADPVRKAGLLARLKSLQAAATFFAAEAYHSEGPLQHVVKAGQSSRLEVEGNGQRYTPDEKKAAIEARKQEKLAALSCNQMLQSFNENLGDLLKDLRHYAAEPFPGLGFYRSSKYIERLCDAVAIIGPKLPESSRAAFGALTIDDQSPGTVQSRIAGLVDIRGEKSGFPTAPDPELEKQAFAIAQMRGIFPSVTTLPDLAGVMKAFGQRVNTIVRDAITAGMQAPADNPYFPRA